MQTSAPSPMSDSSLSQNTLVCKPTKWFLWRVLAMLAMFSIFTVLFLQDGIWGYREKNLQYFVHHNTFELAGKKFQEMQNGESNTEVDWKRFASNEVCQFPEGAEAILPKGTDLKMAWPAILIEGYDLMKDKGGQNGANDLWNNYTSEKGWNAETAEHPMDAGKIRDQFIAAGVTLALIAGCLFLLIRTMRRTIKADDEALYTQDGRKILYSEMTRIDKRKWDTKGLALVYYQAGGEEKKAKIDGMVYGQFKEEDGAPAEKLFSRVMENFKGEVLEYIDTDDDNESDIEESDKVSVEG